MKLNCIVIEDDVIQRMINVKLVDKHPDLMLVGNFSNASEAKKFITVHAVDLIFLDIEMSACNGFDFLDDLKIKPQIIFITSKAEYAIKAFDYNATDYIQKPITLKRFNASIKRALDIRKLKQVDKEKNEHVLVGNNLKKLKVYINKIKWIEGFGDYVKVVTEKDKNLISCTMKSFEEELPKEKFFRIHRSFIINIEKVQRFNGKFVEIGLTKIPLSRNKREELNKVLAIA